MKERSPEATITLTNAFSFLLWCAVAAAAVARRTWLGPIEVLFLLAPLVHVPLGLRVVGRFDGGFSRFGQLAARLLPLGAIAAVASFWAHTGLSAGLLAFGWLFVCLLLAAEGLVRLFRGGYRSAGGMCVCVGLLYLAVGGVWLVLSRSGATPMHFAEPIILLTAVHFHFTGFALPIIAATTGHTLATRAPHGASASLFPYVAAGIVSGPAILAGGFVFGYPPWKLIAALFLATICVVLAAFILLVLPHIEPRAARILLRISAASLIVGMVLAGVYVIGDFTERYWLLIPRMARWHGTANALGFALCGLAGWALANRETAKPALLRQRSARNDSAGYSGQPIRTVIAFLIAPLIAPVAVYEAAFLSDTYSGGTFSAWGLVGGLPLFMLYGLPVAYLAELVLGVPAWLLFKYYRIRSVGAFAGGGALLGLLFYMIWGGWSRNFTIQSLVHQVNLFGSGDLGIFIIAAAASAMLFRYIVFSGPAQQPSK